jgi:two-component system sensor histidine kinase TctE
LREPGLRRRLLAGLLAPLLVLLALDTAFAWWTSRNFADLAHDRSLQELARELVLQIEVSPTGPVLQLQDSAERILLQDAEDEVFFRVSTPQGRMLAGDADLPPPAAPDLTPGRPRFYHTEVQGQPARAVAVWMAYDSAQPEHKVLVQVAETLNKRTRLARDILLSSLLPQLLLIVLATVTVYLGVARGLRPLTRLRAAVSTRSPVDLSPIVQDDVPVEVRPLVEEINELLARLSAAMEGQNRFLADAAHQLKTPVSGLKAQIDLALREHEPQALKRSVAQLYVSADRLSHIVRQLLALARNEPGAAAAVVMLPVDLRKLALDTSMEWAPQALKVDVDLGFEGGDAPVVVQGDPDRLRELLNNLIDNAVRYSARGGRVTVAVQSSGAGGPVLSVSDDSPRIPVEERARIFERFHRLLGTHADGSGLGLAIVSEIAALHGARIVLDDDVDGIGNRFSVRFPMSAG